MTTSPPTLGHPGMAAPIHINARPAYAQVEAAILEHLFACNDGLATTEGSNPRDLSIEIGGAFGFGRVVFQEEEPSYYLANVGIDRPARRHTIAQGDCYFVRIKSAGWDKDGEPVCVVPCPYKVGGKAWKRWQEDAERRSMQVSTSLYLVVLGMETKVLRGTDDHRTIGSYDFETESGRVLRGTDMRADRFDEIDAFFAQVSVDGLVESTDDFEEDLQGGEDVVLCDDERVEIEPYEVVFPRGTEGTIQRVLGHRFTILIQHGDLDVEFDLTREEFEVAA